MSTQGEPSGAVVGHEEGLTEVQQKGPFEDDAEEKEGNGSLKVEILHGITAGGDGNEPV